MTHLGSTIFEIQISSRPTPPISYTWFPIRIHPHRLVPFLLVTSSVAEAITNNQYCRCKGMTQTELAWGFTIKSTLHTNNSHVFKASTFVSVCRVTMGRAPASQVPLSVTSTPCLHPHHVMSSCFVVTWLLTCLFYWRNYLVVFPHTPVLIVFCQRFVVVNMVHEMCFWLFTPISVVRFICLLYT